MGGWAGSWATGCLALHVFQPNAGSQPRVVSSLCRNGCGLAYPRCGRGLRAVALSLAKIVPFYWPSDTSSTVKGPVK